MTAEAFEGFAEGRTLHFTRDGQPFGAEQYFPGRRSLWRFDDGTCEEGRWWGEGETICFEYEADDPQCWHFRGGPEGFTAESLRDGVETGFSVQLSRTDNQPLDCPGPKVGS